MKLSFLFQTTNKYVLSLKQFLHSQFQCQPSFTIKNWPTAQADAGVPNVFMKKSNAINCVVGFFRFPLKHLGQIEHNAVQSLLKHCVFGEFVYYRGTYITNAYIYTYIHRNKNHQILDKNSSTFLQDYTSGGPGRVEFRTHLVDICFILAI